MRLEPQWEKPVTEQPASSVYLLKLFWSGSGLQECSPPSLQRDQERKGTKERKHLLRIKKEEKKITSPDKQLTDDWLKVDGIVWPQLRYCSSSYWIQVGRIWWGGIVESWVGCGGCRPCLAGPPACPSQNHNRRPENKLLRIAALAVVWLPVQRFCGEMFDLGSIIRTPFFCHSRADTHTCEQADVQKEKSKRKRRRRRWRHATLCCLQSATEWNYPEEDLQPLSLNH